MSLLHTTTPYRRDQLSPLRVPVTLPLVEVHVDTDGVLSILINREPYVTDRPLMRDDLRQALTRIADDLQSPVKVEIHEQGETVFTDIVIPGVQPDEAPLPNPEFPTILSPGEVAGDGFLPDEDVAVAVVVAHQVASPDGTARLRLPTALLAGRPGIVVLLGRTSGAIAVSGSTA
ncbi:hypothetical protein [Nocardioides sp.]|uniref:Uncharacterized protein n=1 Tax=metagenome TaxID=256318 RepID=A0A2P2BX14_9ZZZZ